MKKILREWGLVAGMFLVGPVSATLVDKVVAEDIRFVECDNFFSLFQSRGALVKKYDNRTEVVLRSEPVRGFRLVDTDNDGQADVYRAAQLGPMRMPVGYERGATVEEQALFREVMDKYRKIL